MSTERSSEGEDVQPFENLSTPERLTQEETPRVVPPPRTVPEEEIKSASSDDEEKLSISGSHPEGAPNYPPMIIPPAQMRQK